MEQDVFTGTPKKKPYNPHFCICPRGTPTIAYGLPFAKPDYFCQKCGKKVKDIPNG